MYEMYGIKLKGVGTVSERSTMPAPAYATETHYTVTYDSGSHLRVLTQMWGSKWPEVSSVDLFSPGFAASRAFLIYRSQNTTAPSLLHLQCRFYAFTLLPPAQRQWKTRY